MNDLFSRPNDGKVTMQLDADRLQCWPGNVQRWLEREPSGQLAVNHMDGVGLVPKTSLNHETTVRVLGEIKTAVKLQLWAGFPVVVETAELPEHARALV